MIPAAYGALDRRDARFAAAAAAVDAVPFVFGTSVEGRPLTAALAGSRAPFAALAAHADAAADAADGADGADAALPLVLVNGNIHGVEWIAAEAAIAVLAAWSTPGFEPLRRRCRLAVAPCLNPDGAARTERQQGQGTLKELRTNANGVDLNRNFPLPAGKAPSALATLTATTGSSNPHKATYRGTAPFSEPEPRAVDALVRALRPHLTLSFHSFMGTVIPPKVETRAHARAYRGLGRAFRAGQTHFSNWTLMWAGVDVFTGELEDRVHHDHDGWALTIELWPVWRSIAAHLRAPSLFARFNPDDPGVVVADAVAGVAAVIDAALALPRPSAL